MPIYKGKLNNSPYFSPLKIKIIMNKTELVNAIAAAGLTKADSKKALDATLAAISNALKAGDKVALLGFGTFAITERPANKQKIEIPAKKVVKFKAGAELAEAVK